MKCIVSIAHLSELSGSGISLVESAASLQAAGHRSLLVLPGHGDLYARAKARGLELVIINNPEISFSGKGISEKVALLSARATYVKQLSSFLQNNGADLACVNTSTSIFAGIAARMAGVPIAWRIHESQSAKDLRTRIKKTVISKLAAGLIYDSESGMSSFPHPPGKPGLVARNYVPVSKLAPIYTERKQRYSHYEWNNATILMNGTFHRKAPDVLLKSVILLRQRFPQLTPRVTIVGPDPTDPDYAASLKQLSSSPELNGYVRFAGVQPDMTGLFQDADIFVSPSRNEAMPIIIVEAMATGLPVIASDVGDCRKLLDNCGWIVPSESPDALANALAEAMQNPQQTQDIAQAGFEKVQGIYGSPDFWLPLHQFLQKLMQ